MKNTTVIFALFLITNFGCTSEKPIEKEEIKPEILLESIATRLPGELFYSKEKLTLIDPFGKPNFIKIFDANNGELLGSTGSLGQGPMEFMTPSGIQLIDNEFFVYDPNLRSLGSFDLEKVSGVNSEALQKIQRVDLLEGMVKLLRIDNTRYIGANFENSPFSLVDIERSEKVEFGSYPVSEKIVNPMDVFRGTIKYNKERDFLVYSSFSTKYLSLYKVEDGNSAPTLLWEKSVAEPKYRISENNLTWENEQENGFPDICFTKDFIVVSFKEGLNLIDNKGRSTDLVPQSLFVYNYDGDLVKHFDSNTPILRLSDNLESNTVFAVGVTPEFCLMKFNLDD